MDSSEQIKDCPSLALQDNSWPCVLAQPVTENSWHTDDSTLPVYRDPNLGIYLAEGGASFLVGNVVGIGVPILLATSFPLGEGHDLYDPSMVYFLLYPALYSLTSALGVDVTARIFKCRGSYWGAVGGGFLGLATGIGLFIITEFDVMHPNLFTFTFAAILPPCFSVVGYNIFRKDNIEQSDIFFHGRYSVTQVYPSENFGINEFPKISIKIIEIKF